MINGILRTTQTITPRLEATISHNSFFKEAKLKY